MKIFILLLLVLLVSCESEKKPILKDISGDAALIRREIADFYEGLNNAYNGIPINTDSLFDYYFESDVYYVTYWGITEPIDTTKSRLQRALPGIEGYKNRLESMFVRVYDEGAYAFFILRQAYMLNGKEMDEYLPTTFILERRADRWKIVHSHRSADFQTINRLMEIARQTKQKPR
ncbi:MAG: nuclear transport factor 2 family protein [Bacteroidetes bacterium]|nr:nuclear transport factor 2 family protein [Bacteroidota bacterium]